MCELTNISDMSHGRVLDDTSDATIVVDLKGDSADDACCECMGNLRTWINSIIIMRDGELVWGPGPITNIIYRKDQVAFTARDVSAWLDMRQIHEDMDFTEEDPLVVAQSIIDDAFSLDDPCGIAKSTYIQEPKVLGSIDREYTSEDPVQRSGDSFRDLAQRAMDFTVVAKSIIMGEPLLFGPYVTLNDDHFQVEIEVEERGLEAGTKWTVQNSESYGSAGGIDPHYGLLEQIDDQNDSSIDDDEQQEQIAKNHLKLSNPAPLYINIPEGARLSPEAPVCFKQLIPGTLFNVSVRNLCRSVYQQMKLTAVQVKVTNGDEQVGITLSPTTDAILMEGVEVDE